MTTGKTWARAALVAAGLSIPAGCRGAAQGVGPARRAGLGREEKIRIQRVTTPICITNILGFNKTVAIIVPKKCNKGFVVRCKNSEKQTCIGQISSDFGIFGRILLDVENNVYQTFQPCGTLGNFEKVLQRCIRHTIVVAANKE